MKLGIISDLHLKSHMFYIDKDNIIKFINENFQTEKNNDLDIIIIPGDISEENGEIILFLKMLSTLFPNTKILYTHGNHEMWNKKNKHNIDTIQLMLLMEYEKKAKEGYKKEIKNCENNKSSYKKIIALKKEIKKIKNVFYLDGEIIQIDKLKILGIPMWYDFSYGKKLGYTKQDMCNLWKKYMNDYEYIFWDEERFKPLKYFEEQYIKIKNIFKKEKPNIVFSHIGPIVPNNIPKKWQNAGTGFFYFEGKELFEIHKPDIWFFGHTHDKYDFKYDKTRLICNPYGYSNENNNKIKIIEI